MKNDLKSLAYFKKVSKLNDFSKNIHACNSLTQLYDCFSLNIKKLYSFSKGEVIVLCSKKNDFVLHSSWSINSYSLPIELNIPIIINNKLIVKVNLFLEKLADQKLIFDMVEHFVIAYKNIIEKFHYQKAADYDFLTGLYNRRYLDKSLFSNEITTEKYHGNLGVIFIDIDHFKKVNDFYGHDAGDEVLRKVGDCLVNNVNKDEVVFRYGGEEFMIILPNISKESLIYKVNNLLYALKNLNIYYCEEKIKITVSIGCSILNKNYKSNSIGEAIKIADNALYQAKKQGRNQAVFL